MNSANLFCRCKPQHQTVMADQLPIISGTRAVNATATASTSLLGRGLVAILNQKTEIAVAIADQEKRYRQARDVYNRITSDGNQDCTGNCWTDEELAELSDAFETFQRLANTGYGKAYFPLSQFYRGGQSIPGNNVLAQRYVYFAFNWCFDNQLQNDSEIWNDLGTLYRLGDVVETDYTLALYWYQQAADAGDATGMFNVSGIYEFGIGVEEDYEEALDWQFAAAKAGHIAAQYGLGCQYEHGGELLGQDYELAFYWYLQAADGGHKSAVCRVAESSSTRSGARLHLDWFVEQTVTWYRNAAEKGHAVAQTNLGWMYEIGNGVEQDDEQAAFWYRKAAEQGDAEAQCSLGALYEDGRGVEQNAEKAIFWYSKAAEQGEVYAQCNLARMFELGRGVDQNDELSVLWYIKAAQQGHEGAQEYLRKHGINWKNA